MARVPCIHQASLNGLVEGAGKAKYGGSHRSRWVNRIQAHQKETWGASCTVCGLQLKRQNGSTIKPVSTSCGWCVWTQKAHCDSAGPQAVYRKPRH
jgi:hypothetical protein